VIFDLFIRCPFAKLIGKHSRYWVHVSASSSSSFSSTFSGRRFSLQLPVHVRERAISLRGFHACLVGISFLFWGFLILFLFGPFLSCVEQEPPVVFGSTNGRTPPRATYPPFDSLMVAHSMNYSSLLGSAPTTGSLRLFLPSFLSWK
jgi:hypothetical protein